MANYDDNAMREMLSGGVTSLGKMMGERSAMEALNIPAAAAPEPAAQNNELTAQNNWTQVIKI